ncbi:hypothetical protein [Sphingobacterium mizutaii]|uniref:hypothetical protein n=1 Tax=Sphingobacterium mizutaii TaxID=1010 RepID=UPI00162A59F1|nr:hypothetical protein [Sphingobacterium mizutaii]
MKNEELLINQANSLILDLTIAFGKDLPTIENLNHLHKSVRKIITPDSMEDTNEQLNISLGSMFTIFLENDTTIIVDSSYFELSQYFKKP